MIDSIGSTAADTARNSGIVTSSKWVPRILTNLPRGKFINFVDDLFLHLVFRVLSIGELLSLRLRLSLLMRLLLLLHER